MSVRVTVIVVILLISIGAGGFVGYGFVSRLMAWRHLDQTYQEQFRSPAEVAPELKGKKVLFQVMHLLPDWK